MTEYYRIGGIYISITGEFIPPREPLKIFICEPVADPDVRISIVGEPFRSAAPPVFSERGAVWRKSEGGGWLYSFSHDDTIIVSAVIDSRWREVELYINQNKTYDSYFMKPALETLFYNICLKNGGVVLHAAAIEWNGAGVVFSAPSGTGKSTQADLWVRRLGATYINGDRPLLMVQDDETFVYGTAWSGSAGIYKNTRAPLTALIFLEQYPVNMIHALNPSETLKYILPRCFLPYHDRELMGAAMDNIEAIIARTDCWLLRCLPDAGAMDLVRKCVMTSRKFNG